MQHYRPLHSHGVRSADAIAIGRVASRAIEAAQGPQALAGHWLHPRSGPLFVRFGTLDGFLNNAFHGSNGCSRFR